MHLHSVNYMLRSLRYFYPLNFRKVARPRETRAKATFTAAVDLCFALFPASQRKHITCPIIFTDLILAAISMTSYAKFVMLSRGLLWVVCRMYNPPLRVQGLALRGNADVPMDFSVLGGLG